MTDLSPAARAVWEAFRQFDEAGMHVDYDVKIAAALRALGSQLGHEIMGARVVDCSQIQLIAAELEGHG